MKHTTKLMAILFMAVCTSTNLFAQTTEVDSLNRTPFEEKFNGYSRDGNNPILAKYMNWQGQRIAYLDNESTLMDFVMLKSRLPEKFILLLFFEDGHHNKVYMEAY